MDAITRPRRVQRVRHELMRREVKVTRVAPLGGSFVSVTFAGDSLESFVSLGFDDHIKFIFNSESGEQVMRDYTPRHFDREARELTIEFALHGEGQACGWAQRATPGQSAIIGGPRGSMIIPLDYDWHLLAGDSTALPAINRRLEELPAGTRAMVIVQLDSDADRRELRSAAQTDIRWTRNADEFLSALRELQLPEGDGYVWCAGEFSLMKRARALFAGDKGHPKEAMRIAAYWRQGASDFHEDLGD